MQQDTDKMRYGYRLKSSRISQLLVVLLMSSGEVRAERGKNQERIAASNKSYLCVDDFAGLDLPALANA